MAIPKPPASKPIQSKPSYDSREMSDEFLRQIGEEMSRQLDKAKPAPEPLARKSEPLTSWESDVTPAHAHSLWDEEIDTKKFVRVEKGDLTDRVESLPAADKTDRVELQPSLEHPKSFWERFKGLVLRIF
jgi:hypothetical protein